MRGKRIQRVSELIKQSLGQSILTKVRDPRLGFVTITQVEITPDLQYAKVYYTVFGDEKNKKSSAIALEHSRGFLQRELAAEVKMRVTPILSFHYDHSIQEGMRIEDILKKIHDEEKQD